MNLDAVLGGQAGVISREQALAAGLSRDVIDHRLRLRRFRPLHPRVYLAAGYRADAEVRVRAALLWAGGDAVLGGLGAAWWFGMVDEAPAQPTVTVGRRRRARSRQGVGVWRRDLAAEDRAVHRGLPVTARPLTVLEAAVELGASGSVLLDTALQRWVRFSAVHAAHCRNLGSYGSASAGRLLVGAADRSASAAGRLMVRLLRESGAAGWQCAFPSAGFVIDVAFPAARVAIEPVGWAWHTDAGRAQAATRRQHALLGHGWTILRYPWHELVDRPGVVLAEIAGAVQRGTSIRK